MGKTIGRFDIRVTQMKKGDDFPVSPFVQVVLDHWMHAEGESAPIISAHLMSEGEIDEHFNNLIEDLNRVRVHAKGVLKLAHARTNEIVASR